MDFDRSLPPDPALDRLLGEIHLRIRQARFVEAETRLVEANTLAPGHPAVRELDGDLAFARRKFKQAELCYREALIGDPTNDKLEEKYATAVVKVHEPEIVAHSIPGGDSPWSNRVPRPPFLSAGLSSILPGLGQWYNGDLLKAVIGIVAWLLIFFGQLSVVLAELRKVRIDGDGTVISAIFSGGNIVLIVLATALWIYAIVDAYLVAVQTNDTAPAMLSKRPRATAASLPTPPARPKKR